jgi:hypothetical protein
VVRYLVNSLEYVWVDRCEDRILLSELGVKVQRVLLVFLKWKKLNEIKQLTEYYPLRHGQITIKTPDPKCRLYWCLMEFIDWRYSQKCWYFRPLL